MKNILLTFFSICCLSTFSNATTVSTINPEQDKQQVEEFRGAINAFQLNIKKGELNEAKLMLNEVLLLAQSSYKNLAKKSSWIDQHACDNADMDKIRYNSKGRVTKQDELIQGLKVFSSKTELSEQDLNTAVSYCKFFHESMQDSHNEIMAIVNNCM